MIKVEIKNFQSISHMEFEIDGFATIIGRNFIGKSATLRAISAALTNRQGTDFIRWGEKFCEVRIQTRGYDILWHKEDGNNFYIINGERYDKIGREEPPEPIKEAGFSIIKLGTDKVNLNYAEQFNPLFLVDRQDSKGADLLTSVYGLDVIYKAVELCGKEQKSNKDDLRIRKKDLEFIEKDLLRFEGFDAILERGRSLKDSKKILESSQDEVLKLKNLESSIRESYLKCNKLKGILDINLPESLDVNSEVSLLEGLRSKYSQIDKLNKGLNSLKGIDDVDLPDAPDLDKEINEISMLKVSSSRIGKIQGDLAKYKDLDSIKVPELDANTEEIEILRTKKDIIKNLSADLKGIEESLSKLDISQKKVGEELESFDVCPLCGV